MEENNNIYEDESEDAIFCIDYEEDSDYETQEKLEFTFEVKDKYKEVINKVISVSPSALLKFNVNYDRVMQILFDSINVNTAKVNWTVFNEAFKYLVLDKAERKKIKKLIKNLITEEFIETELKRQDDDYESMLGTERFDVITKRNGVITFGNMLEYFDFYGLVKLDDLFNRGSKTYIRLAEDYFATADYTETILGMLIGTFGKVNENLKVHIARTERRKFGSNNFNFITEEIDECKTVLQEQLIDSMQITVLNVSDLLKTASSKEDYKNIFKGLKRNEIDELNIPIMNMDQQLSIKFSVDLTADNGKLMSETEALDKIFNKEGLITIREVYIEKFKRAIFNNSIIQQYLRYKNTYDENTDGTRKSDKKSLMKQIEECYGKDSLIYKYFDSSILEKYDTYDVESFIRLFVSRLDEIITDDLEEGTWNCECITSNLPRLVIAKVMTAIKEAGNKVNFFEIETIE